MDAISMLQDDHRRVEALFARYARTTDERQRTEIVRAIKQELDVHAAIEEEIFYPAARRSDPKVVDVATEEHELVKAAVRELAGSRPGARRNARVEALRRVVQMHVAEEEGRLLPRASRALGRDGRRVLAERMLEHRQSLLGVSPLGLMTSAAETVQTAVRKTSTKMDDATRAMRRALAPGGGGRRKTTVRVRTAKAGGGSKKRAVSATRTRRSR